MSRPGQIQYDIRFPRDLFERMDRAAKRNWREFTGELCFAVERYIEEGAAGPTPTYEGKLTRRKLWLPVDLHETVKRVAADRNTSANKVYMAASIRHVEREEAGAP